MMINKRVVALLMALAVVLKCSMFGVIQVFAHDAILDVE